MQRRRLRSTFEKQRKKKELISKHEEEKLPTSETESRRVVLECEKLEVIDGVLHHDNPVDPGQWCVVVPSNLRQTLLAESHSSVFSGHFSERKIYERLRRRYTGGLG